MLYGYLFGSGHETGCYTGFHSTVLDFIYDMAHPPISLKKQMFILDSLHFFGIPDRRTGNMKTPNPKTEDYRFDFCFSSLFSLILLDI